MYLLRLQNRKQLRIHLRQQIAAVQSAGGHCPSRLILDLACLLRAHQRVLLLRQHLGPPQDEYVVRHDGRKALVLFHQHAGPQHAADHHLSCGIEHLQPIPQRHIERITRLLHSILFQ
jgi:hypothetical protein